MLQFIKDFTDKLNEHSVQQQTMKLADDFTIHGASVKNGGRIIHYKEFMDLTQSTAKKAGNGNLDTCARPN